MNVAFGEYGTGTGTVGVDMAMLQFCNVVGLECSGCTVAIINIIITAIRTQDSASTGSLDSN
jgi:hypothetical protein